MTAWDVYQNNKWIDTVFFEDDCDEQWVLDSLIKHDGLPLDITVKPSQPLKMLD